MFWMTPALWALLGCAPEPPVERPPPHPVVHEDRIPCLGAPPCVEERIVRVDDGGTVVEVPYDLTEVTRRVRLAELPEESELSVAVRLLLGEIGAQRLLENQHGREEALAILATVKNRLDPAIWDPEGRSTAPWPGCEPGASFASCANAEQYRGLQSWRALHPAEHVDAPLLEPAIDEVVAAWWLLKSGAAGDPTGGATSFVHRCGGSAYGQPASECEGMERYTGPAIFRGPVSWDAASGRYKMWRRHVVEFARR